MQEATTLLKNLEFRAAVKAQPCRRFKALGRQLLAMYGMLLACCKGTLQCFQRSSRKLKDGFCWLIEKDMIDAIDLIGAKVKELGLLFGALQGVGVWLKLSELGLFEFSKGC